MRITGFFSHFVHLKVEDADNNSYREIMSFLFVRVKKIIF